jgi:hypothetical protein
MHPSYYECVFIFEFSKFTINVIEFKHKKHLKELLKTKNIIITIKFFNLETLKASFAYFSFCIFFAFSISPFSRWSAIKSRGIFITSLFFEENQLFAAL